MLTLEQIESAILQLPPMSIETWQPTVDLTINAGGTIQRKTLLMEKLGSKRGDR